MVAVGFDRFEKLDGLVKRTVEVCYRELMTLVGKFLQVVWGRLAGY